MGDWEQADSKPTGVILKTDDRKQYREQNGTLAPPHSHSHIPCIMHKVGDWEQADSKPTAVNIENRRQETISKYKEQNDTLVLPQSHSHTCTRWGVVVGLGTSQQLSY